MRLRRGNVAGRPLLKQKVTVAETVSLVPFTYQQDVPSVTSGGENIVIRDILRCETVELSDLGLG